MTAAARPAWPISMLARSLGYTSERAFSDAFKRVTGHAPNAIGQTRELSSEPHPMQHLSSASASS
jgi:AraC-like DNA-binding protein